MDQSASPDSNKAPAPAPQQQQTNMTKVAEYAMTNGEVVLFAELEASFSRLRTLSAMYMAEKHGYPEQDPVAFNFDFKNRTVSAYLPSKIDVAKDLPSNAPPAPATDKTT